MSQNLMKFAPPAVDPAFRNADRERADIVDRFDDRTVDRLPPPVFPPGQRRSRPMRLQVAAQEDIRLGTAVEDIPREAFISPDSPLRPRDERMAFVDEIEGEVTGIGGDHTNDYPSIAGEPESIPSVEQVALILEGLSMRLRSQGAAALRTEAGLSSIESSLREFLAGYLSHLGGHE